MYLQKTKVLHYKETVMQIQEGGLGGLFPCSIASLTPGVASRRTGVLVRVRTTLQAVAERSHERAHLVLQGLRGLFVFIWHHLQDRVETKIRPAERVGVVEPAKVGEDQPARLSKQITSLDLHDRIHLADRLL